ncbi:MAG: nucleotidyltransferase family protein [Desulfomonile tiedjei]|nr:nucleotidyltransferase family protein [Desulfomonile tiedjei]
MVSDGLASTALILVGGLGTRLLPVVSDRPKPMALVHGVPFLEILIGSLSLKGLRRFVLLAGHMADMIEDYFKEPRISGVRITCLREDEPMGTGGAVKHAEPFATDPSILINGDTFFDADLGRLLRFHHEKKAAATLSLMRVEDVGRYGAVEIDGAGHVVRFEEKRSGPARPGLINAGFTLLSAAFIRNLPEDRAFSMEEEILPQLVGAEELFGLTQEGAFYDIGTPESYEAFKAYATERWGLTAPRRASHE